MRVDKDRDSLALERMQNLANLDAAQRVDSIGRLVKDQHSGSCSKACASPSRCSMLSNTCAPDIRPVLQADNFQQFWNSFAAGGGVGARQRTIEIEHPARGQVGGEAMVLRQVTHRFARGRLDDSCPKMRALPEVGCTAESSILTKVVLPAPLGPNRPKVVPRSTESETPLTAVNSFFRQRVRNILVRLSVSIAMPTT